MTISQKLLLIYLLGIGVLQIRVCMEKDEDATVLQFILDTLDDTQQKSFEKFYDDYYGLAVIIADKHIPNTINNSTRKKYIEECMQEMWMECAASYDNILLHKGREQQKYVGGIMRNVANDYFHAELEGLHNTCIGTISPEELLAMQADLQSEIELLNIIEKEDLKQAVLSLSDKNRYVLELYYYRDKTIEEISQLLGVAPAAVYKRIERSIQIIEKKLTSKGGYLA